VTSGTVSEQQLPQEEVATGDWVSIGVVSESQVKQDESAHGSSRISGSAGESQSAQLESITGGSISTIVSIGESQTAQVESALGSVASAIYVYDISTETMNGKLNIETMTRDILDASLSSGGTIEGIEVNGGTLGDPGVIDGGTMYVRWSSGLDAPDKSLQDSIVAAHNGYAFNEGPFKSESIGVSSTTSIDTKVSMASGPLSEGTWRFEGSGEIRLVSVAPGSLAVARVRLNGATLIEQSTAGNEWISFFVVTDVPVKAGDSPVMDIEFERSGSFNTVEIQRARLSAFQQFN
jgi:hypothetical protein